jgi:hypothetical protein
METLKARCAHKPQKRLALQTAPRPSVAAPALDARNHAIFAAVAGQLRDASATEPLLPSCAPTLIAIHSCHAAVVALTACANHQRCFAPL